MAIYLLADVGSTWTKLTAVDSKGNIVGQASAPTTVKTDIMEGVDAALREIRLQTGRKEDSIYACSSAAGGLAMIACGLVPELPVRLQDWPCWGRGQVLRVLVIISMRMLRKSKHSPDILLLGELTAATKILLENAQALADMVSPLPVVLAGNRNAAARGRKSWKLPGSA